MRKTTSTNFENEQQLHEWCTAAFTLSVISGRWKLTILVKLLDQDLKFGELKQAIPGITERVLALQLKNLERDQLILKVADEPNGHLYRLSPTGRSLEGVINSLSGWGAVHQPVPSAK
ncbi:winged helix-turn-helix transcriptional regulator [Pedobacter caeni]|uniref:Transcriptional regulator, HxlR family n=1 Tax=Pedobacter caeni TaxID=288992 RepID=A0A1M5LDE9_9SPHI|nr:helix-turn-helix domain-containing protein [Pedobacter caeni]SHG63132.1 transcriptional regulator, HxlR family [Pedobacter caeni]